MDVLTPAGELLHVTPDGEHADLFAAFPNSYGTLGYALRLVVELAPVKPFVKLTHHRYPTASAASAAIERFVAAGRSTSSTGSCSTRRAVPDHR